MNQNTKINSYILATGNQTDYRLSILNKIYGKYTSMLLDKLELLARMKVAVIGCGSGESIDLIYKKIGKGGKLLCLDISKEQIDLTKRKLSGKNIGNVEYKVADIQNYQGNEEYDLVYCRFLLVHLTDPEQALNNMLSLLKPNGIIACEEHDYKTIFSYPYASSIDKFKELLKAISQKLGVDYSYGVKLFHTLSKLSLKEVKFDFHLPVFNGREEKSLFKLSLLEGMAHYIDNKLIDDLEIEKMVKEMEEIIQDEIFIQSSGGVFQSWGRKKIGKIE